MPERPLLKLPDPVQFVPRPGPRGGGNLAKPSRQQQGNRLAPRFQRLLEVADSPQQLLALRNDPTVIAPERAIVFEVAGQLSDFYTQAQALGLEYLGDYEEEIDPSDDFHDRDRPEKVLAGRIYLAMPDARSLRELLGLWNRFRSGQRMPDGRSEWRELFSLLIDVRPWGPQDRVPPETIEYWRETLRDNPNQPVRFEIELWYHEDRNKRDAARTKLEAELAAIGGTIVHNATVSEIRYDALLVDIPAARAEDLINNPAVTLARNDEVMFLRPQSAAKSRKEEPAGEDAPDVGIVETPPLAQPIAALLDGLPIQNHTRLRGRITVDDPEDLDDVYPVSRRAHGTEMASLIVHGDLARDEEPLQRLLFVHPVMRPDAWDSERTPADRLLVDVIHRAVRRMKIGDGDEAPTAPAVVLINLSLGDPWRPFARVMSPLGRLIDFLSFRYRVLFLISAGNILDRIDVPEFQTASDFEQADPEDREKAVLSALNRLKSQRTLFSPAESINSLTIGASHSSHSYGGNLPANLIDPFTSNQLPNIASANGLGFRKAIKPDLLFEGGRTPVRIVASGGGVTIQPVRSPARLFGLKVASPNAAGGTRHEDFAWGTSVATALATRAGHQIYDSLLGLGEASNHNDLSPDYQALALKALLVHGSSWGPKGEMLENFFGPRGTGQHISRRDDIARLFGYGFPDVMRVIDCAENRATLLGTGSIDANGALLYRVPLPAQLNGAPEFRALTTTLAWFSPINSRHQGYRQASLDISSGSEEKYWIVSDRDACQPTDKTIVRGSVFHERRTGDKAAIYIDDGDLLLRVSCRSSAGDLTESVPYALVVSFEVGVGAGIDVYNEVRTRITPQVRAGAIRA